MRRHVSVVVPTLNRKASVLRLLRTLEHQTDAEGLFEVVVVDDGSTDGTADAVAAHAAPFELRCLRQPFGGLAAARNAGARASHGDLLLFLDDDMEAAPALVAGHLHAHRDEKVLAVVGAAPIVVGPDSPPIVRYRAVNFGRKLERLAGRRTRLAFDDVYGGNFSIRRNRLLEVGGYDETFRGYGHEDYELSFRLSRTRGRFIFAPGALAHQHYEKTLRQLAADVESEGRTAVLLARLHPDALPSLTLGGFARRSRLARARVGAVVALCRRVPALQERMIRFVERLEARGPAIAERQLFARYDALFDALYWIGAEAALRERGAPRGRLAVRHVERWIRTTG
jgi:glycosyltransferase involved in cell wall biosynthesis